MKANVLNLRGEVVRTMDLDDRVFGITPNEAVVHQAVVTQQANARQGTHDTKTRAEVAGGGKKPYRQKGTGHARQGSIRAPHYRGGGVVFGPHPRSHEKSMPRKMRRLAVRSVLSARAAEQAITVIEDLDVPTGKTRDLLQTLAALGIVNGALVVVGERSEPLLRAAKNLQKVHAVTPNGLNLLDMLRLPLLLMTESAIDLLTRTLTNDLRAGSGTAAGETLPPSTQAEADEPSAPRRRRTGTSKTSEPEEANP